MSRLEGVPEGSGGPFTRFTYFMTKRQLGRLVEPIQVAAHHPLLMKGYGAFEWTMDRAHEVDEGLKDLAATKAAAIIGCEFCLDIGSAECTRAGITREQLEDLPRYRDSDRFSEREKLVLDYAVGMTRTPVEVSDELFEALHREFTDAQLVELTTAIALENYRGRFNWAFGIGSSGFTEGAFCAVPERPPAETSAA
jgi:4-carboxymuconolactone decarboxylase